MAGYMACEVGLDTFEGVERMVLLSNLGEGVPAVFQLRSSELDPKRLKGGKLIIENRQEIYSVWSY